jgi:RNA 2',3'-cyclic 3'-phosphodiesterase
VTWHGRPVQPAATIWLFTPRGGRSQKPYTPHMRLFIAIPLAEAVEAELKRLTARLRPAAPDLRWSLPESWHITLQFLGNTSEEQCACLLSRLARLKAFPVPIDFDGLGVFERAGVFILKVAPTTELAGLQKEVVTATHPCGFESEDRPYRPHITLARSKSGSRSRELRSLPDRAGESVRFDRFIATEFRLYESHLSAAGSKYEVKCRFPLAIERGGA